MVCTPATNASLPKDASKATMFNWGELRSYYGIPKNGPLPDTTAKNLIHGYYACVSYVDAQNNNSVNLPVFTVHASKSLGAFKPINGVNGGPRINLGNYFDNTEYLKKNQI